MVLLALQKCCVAGWVPDGAQSRFNLAAISHIDIIRVFKYHLFDGWLGYEYEYLGSQTTLCALPWYRAVR
jgi:hypothetical protein